CRVRGLGEIEDHGRNGFLGRGLWNLFFDSQSRMSFREGHALLGLPLTRFFHWHVLLLTRSHTLISIALFRLLSALRNKNMQLFTRDAYAVRPMLLSILASHRAPLLCLRGRATARPVLPVHACGRRVHAVTRSDAPNTRGAGRLFVLAC